MSYANPLHASVRPSHHSSYSSISGAYPSQSSSQSVFLSPTRRRVPQESVLKYGGGNTRVDRPVSFDFIGYSGQGVHMRELSSRGAHALASMISGATDPVFSHLHMQSITLRIMWPGYSHTEWAKPIALQTPHGLLSRAQLGATVAMHFARFLEKAQYESPRAGDWRVGPNAIGFEHLVLVALWNVVDDVWQADIAIDRR